MLPLPMGEDRHERNIGASYMHPQQLVALGDGTSNTETECMDTSSCGACNRPGTHGDETHVVSFWMG